MSLPTLRLHTARLQLRPFKDTDANALFALHSSAYVLRYWDAPPWSERVRADKFITTCRQMAEEGTGARLAMDCVSDGAFIGWCSLTRWNPNYRSASMGYCLGFVREGRLREDCVVNGEVSDSWVYGLIRREWRPSSGPVRVR